MEHKTLLLSDCEIKMSDSGTFSGYASVFNGVDSYGDTILPGAYKGSLAKNGIPKMFLLHRSFELPIGKWLDAGEDQKGLFVKGELTPGMSKSSDVHAAMKHGTIEGLSIGYGLERGDYKPSDKAEGGRIIKNVTWLHEISPVTYPADSAAKIDLASVKTAMDGLTSLREIEYYLRDAGGFSKSAAEALIAKFKHIVSQGEPDDSILEQKSIEALLQRINQFKLPTA